MSPHVDQRLGKVGGEAAFGDLPEFDGGVVGGGGDHGVVEGVPVEIKDGAGVALDLVGFFLGGGRLEGGGVERGGENISGLTLKAWPSKRPGLLKSPTTKGPPPPETAIAKYLAEALM